MLLMKLCVEKMNNEAKGIPARCRVIQSILISACKGAETGRVRTTNTLKELVNSTKTRVNKRVNHHPSLKNNWTGELKAR